MSNRILVTDSLFIFDEHIKQLEAAGFEVERLDKPEASEEELCEAVKGKVGYILGGVEKITKPVIEAADLLKAIVFTGIGYKHFIPAWEYATEKDIAIANVPDGPTNSVAEWAVTAALAMNRGFFELAAPDGKTFLTTQGLEGATIGIIGLGRIGSRIAELVQAFRPAATLYYSTHHHEDKETSLGLQYKEKEDVLAKSDVVFLCVPADEVGKGYVSQVFIDKLKDRGLLVTFHHSDIFDANALFKALQTGKIRFVSDHPTPKQFNALPRSVSYTFKASNAFNTNPSLKFTSDQATQSLINLLTVGNDQYKVN